MHREDLSSMVIEGKINTKSNKYNTYLPYYYFKFRKTGKNY